MRAGGPVYSIESTEDEAETNESLRQLLKLEHSVELPELEPSETLEDYFAKLEKKKPNKFAHWRVRRFVAFGVFPSSQLAMYEDLNTAEHFDPNEALAKLLIGSDGGDDGSSFSAEYDVDSPDVETSVPHLVLDSDSSQFSALVDIASEQDVALEGPPGTGKSQTIVNAIAGAIAEGKKVLFVAEKMAALEVVRDRLDTLGLGEFLLTLQPNLSKRAMVVDSLRKRLDLQKTSRRGLSREKKRNSSKSEIG